MVELTDKGSTCEQQEESRLTSVVLGLWQLVETAERRSCRARTEPQGKIERIGDDRDDSAPTIDRARNGQ
jgi:hypothetical protein